MGHVRTVMRADGRHTDHGPVRGLVDSLAMVGIEVHFGTTEATVD